MNAFHNILADDDSSLDSKDLVGANSLRVEDRLNDEIDAMQGEGRVCRRLTAYHDKM